MTLAVANGLESTAIALVADGKGILAADEASPTLTKRFVALGIESTAQSRRTYREMLFTSPGVAIVAADQGGDHGESAV